MQESKRQIRHHLYSVFNQIEICRHTRDNAAAQAKYLASRCI